MLQGNVKTPLRAWHAAEEIEAQRSEFGESVTGQVRLGEQAESGNPAGLRKLMPARFTHAPELQVADNFLKQRPQRSQITQRLGRAAVGFYNLLDSIHPSTPRYGWA